jgi:hypothetical protein
MKGFETHFYTKFNPTQVHRTVRTGHATLQKILLDTTMQQACPVLAVVTANQVPEVVNPTYTHITTYSWSDVW